MTECFRCGKKLRVRMAYEVKAADGSQYLVCSGRCLRDLGQSEQDEGR